MCKVAERDNDFKSESNTPSEMAHSFRDEEFAVHKVQNTPVGRSKLYSRQSSMWSSSISSGLSLSAWFGGDNCSPSSSSTSSFLPSCGTQSSASDVAISRENLRYSDPTTHKMNSNSRVAYDADTPRWQREREDDTALGTISSILWGAVARHVEKLSDTDMQLAGLI